MLFLAIKAKFSLGIRPENFTASFTLNLPKEAFILWYFLHSRYSLGEGYGLFWA
jgi:hypothetical protein